MIDSTVLESPALRANLDALEGEYPDLARGLRTVLSEANFADAPWCDLEILPAKTGEDTLRLRELFVHSRYEPRAEAARILSGEDSARATCILFYGTGLAYHIEAAADVNKLAGLIVVEPRRELLAVGLSRVDLSGLIRSGRLSFVVDAAPASLSPVLKAFSTAEITTVRLRALAAYHSEYWREMDGVLTALDRRDRTNAATLARFGRRWVRNLVANLPLLARARPVAELAGAFSGVPALLLAAGPTLDRVLPNLDELRRRALVIAVDTALPAALRAGTDPDVVVVVDPQYWNSRHLDGCGGSRALVVSESSTYPRSLRILDRVPFFGSSLFPLGSALESALGEMGRLGAGGSVATTAWDLARHMDCSSVYCAGLDLAFPGYRTHARGSLYERYFLLRSGRKGPAETGAFGFLYGADPRFEVDYAGTPVLTDARMAVYRFWFELQVAGFQLPTYSLSGQSLNIAGIRPVSPEAILELPEIRSNLDERLEKLRGARVAGRPSEGAKTRREQKLEGAVSQLRRSLESLLALARQGEAVATAAVTAAHSTGARERAGTLERLNEIDAKLGQDQDRHVAAFLADEALRTIVVDGRGGSSGDDPYERSLRSSLALYGSLARSIQEHLDLLKISPWPADT